MNRISRIFISLLLLHIVSLKAGLAAEQVTTTQTQSIETTSIVDGIGSEIRNTIKTNEANETKVTNIPDSPAEVSDFAASPFKLNSGTAQVPVETRLRIEVETPITAEKAIIGQQFKARVLNDFYLSGDFRKLIIPKNSWIRGKVSQVKKPRLLSRAGKLGIKLDTLVTPLGDYVPLNADLVFMEGVVNAQGLLDPQTGFSDKAIEPTQNLLSTDTGKIVSVATLGVPVIGTLIGGTAIALFSHGDSASVSEGQELQIVLTRNTDLAI